MGGGGGGGTFVHRSPQDLARLVKESEDKTSVAAFEARLASMLGDLLGDYNARDHQLVRQRLDEIEAAISDSVEGEVDQLFGGSVAKHTYVDGLSDVDSLVILNDTDLAGGTPQQALRRMTAIVREHLGKTVAVDHGRMAVTITYAEGMQIQLLPAVKVDGGGLRVPSSRTDHWSHIDPSGFQQALTRRNDECGGKLVPTIKLAKAVNGTLPENSQLSGYHMESIAIAAFRDYNGPKTTAAMLPTLFERAKELVLNPMRDSTGQSVHVDEYLGDERSDERIAAGHVLGRIAKRMRNASASGSLAQWESIFGLGE